MPAARVVFADLPLMMRELATEVLRRHARLQVVGLDDGFDLGFADLRDGELTPSGLILLEMAARPKILGLHDARECVLYELRPHREMLGELSEDVLARVLASVTGGPR